MTTRGRSSAPARPAARSARDLPRPHDLVPAAPEVAEPGLHRTRLAEWHEWKDRCALDLCSGPTQQSLAAFAAIHFGRFLRRYAHLTNQPRLSSQLTGRESWHHLETFLMVRNSSEGKRYKEWLFARADGAPAGDQLDAVAGTAALLLRDAVREHLRQEHAPRGMVSLSAPVPGAESAGLTLEDLLPGSISPADEVAAREFERIAEAHARAFFDAAERRGRVAILAKHLGLSLADPSVLHKAGCAKSMLNDAYHRLFEDVSRRLKAEYCNDDADAVRLIVLMTFQQMSELSREWGRSDLSAAQLIAMAEAP